MYDSLCSADMLSIHADELGAKEVQFQAQEPELAVDGLEGFEVVLAEIGDGLVVGDLFGAQQ